MSEYDPDFIGPIRAPDYLPLEFQIIFIRSVLRNWLQPKNTLRFAMMCVSN